MAVTRCRSPAGLHSPVDPGLGLQVRFAFVDGVELALVGEVWAAFSPTSGQTTLLNDESAALLECLRDGPADLAVVSAALAIDCDLPAEQVAAVIETHWPRLTDAGLLRCHADNGMLPV